MASLLSAEINATCSSLGYHDGNKYYKDPYCLETVKDLIRYLRRDDESHEIRRQLGEAQVLRTDLLPILKEHWKEKELFDAILRLLVNLTNPALLLYREELPEDKTSRNYYLQIISHLQKYKEAFADDKIWEVLCKKLGDVLQHDWSERSEENNLLVARILILVRNVLQVPADPEYEKRTDNDASVHDQILWALHLSGMEDLFLFIGSSENESQFYMHILEIISLMLREQNPATLAQAAAQRSIAEKERDEYELLQIRQMEAAEKMKKMKTFAGSRHSRFRGTYWVKNVKSIGDNDLVFHKSLCKLDTLSFDEGKNKQKPPRNRRPMKENSVERRSAFSIRLFLKEFCIEFLNGAYNYLMHNVKDALQRARTEANDESYYMWAMKFFMEFNRSYKFRVELVSETMSIQAFHYVQSRIENCYEMMVTDKKKIPLWSRRMHLALRAYQELLMTLVTMDKSPDEGVRESARVMKSNIFYIVEYRELIVTLLINYDEVKLSRKYLKDLIETAHVFLKLLEQFCTKTKNVVVQGKSKKHRKKAQKKRGNQSSDANQAAARGKEEAWDEIGPQLSTVLQGQSEIPNDMVPFDAASDLDIDEQKADAMRRIQTYLFDGKFEEAIGLLRAAREVWPENDFFGSQNMAPEEEFLAMREIFLADIQALGARGEQRDEQIQQTDAVEDEDEEDEEDEALGHSAVEHDFNFMEFVHRFANSRIIPAYGLLLRQYDKNSSFTNHCIVKMFHRIAWECKLPAMLFQASLFRTFQRILDTPPALVTSSIKEMIKLIVHIVRRFAEIAEKNKKTFMELLFWKKSMDAHEIEHGYGTYFAKTKASKAVWTEEEEDELRRLFEEFQAEHTGHALLDQIMENMINPKSQRLVAKKLKELGLIADTKDIYRKSVSVRLPKDWAEEEVEELTALYHELKDAIDPMGCILARLTVKRPKNRVVEKLLELGLVQDKKELWKKRKPTSRGRSREGDSDSDQESGESTGSENENQYENENRSATRVAKRAQHKPAPKKKPQPPAKPLSAPEVMSLLKEMMEQGKNESLQWIASTIEEVATDRETDGDMEPVPLLPLTEETIDSMEDEKFQQLLKALGILPPADEQEIYWRIPADLSVLALRKRSQVVQNALEGQLSIPEVTEQDGDVGESSAQPTEDNLEMDMSDSHEEEQQPKKKKKGDRGRDRKEKKKRKKKDAKAKKKQKYTSKSASEDDVDELNCEPEEESQMNAGFAEAVAKRLREIASSDSDDDVTLMSLTVKNNDVERIEDQAKSKHSHKKRRVIMHESSDEEPEVSNTGMEVEEEHSKTQVVVDSDSDEGKAVHVKRSHRIIDSDED